MELVKERKMFYEKPNNIDVFLTYFSLNSEPVYRKIYSNELETRVILRNNNLCWFFKVTYYPIDTSFKIFFNFNFPKTHNIPPDIF